jgi:hypothetical protein
MRLALAVIFATGCADPFIEATTALSDTADPAGPYTVWTSVFGVDRSDSVELRYRVDGGDEVTARMRRTDDPGDDPGELHRGAIPGQPAGSEISYRVAVERGGETVGLDPPESAPPFVFSVTP